MGWLREVEWLGSGVAANESTDEELDQRLKYAYTYRLAGKPSHLIDRTDTVQYAPKRGAYCYKCFTGFECNRRCGHAELPILYVCKESDCGLACHACCLDSPHHYNEFFKGDVSKFRRSRAKAKIAWYCAEHNYPAAGLRRAHSGMGSNSGMNTGTPVHQLGESTDDLTLARTQSYLSGPNSGSIVDLSAAVLKSVPYIARGSDSTIVSSATQTPADGGVGIQPVVSSVGEGDFAKTGPSSDVAIAETSKKGAAKASKTNSEKQKTNSKKCKSSSKLSSVKEGASRAVSAMSSRQNSQQDLSNETSAVKLDRATDKEGSEEIVMAEGVEELTAQSQQEQETEHEHDPHQQHHTLQQQYQQHHQQMQYQQHQRYAYHQQHSRGPSSPTHVDTPFNPFAHAHAHKSNPHTQGHPHSNTLARQGSGRAPPAPRPGQMYRMDSGSSRGALSGPPISPRALQDSHVGPTAQQQGDHPHAAYAYGEHVPNFGSPHPHMQAHPHNRHPQEQHPGEFARGSNHAFPPMSHRPSASISNVGGVQRKVTMGHAPDLRRCESNVSVTEAGDPRNNPGVGMMGYSMGGGMSMGTGMGGHRQHPPPHAMRRGSYGWRTAGIPHPQAQGQAHRDSPPHHLRRQLSQQQQQQQQQYQGMHHEYEGPEMNQIPGPPPNCMSLHPSKQMNYSHIYGQERMEMHDHDMARPPSRHMNPQHHPYVRYGHQPLQQRPPHNYGQAQALAAPYMHGDAQHPHPPGMLPAKILGKPNMGMEKESGSSGEEDGAGSNTSMDSTGNATEPNVVRPLSEKKVPVRPKLKLKAKPLKPSPESKVAKKVPKDTKGVSKKALKKGLKANGTLGKQKKETDTDEVDNVDPPYEIQAELSDVQAPVEKLAPGKVKAEKKPRKKTKTASTTGTAALKAPKKMSTKESKGTGNEPKKLSAKGSVTKPKKVAAKKRSGDAAGVDIGTEMAGKGKTKSSTKVSVRRGGAEHVPIKPKGAVNAEITGELEHTHTQAKQNEPGSRFVDQEDGQPVDRSSAETLETSRPVPSEDTPGEEADSNGDRADSSGDRPNHASAEEGPHVHQYTHDNTSDHHEGDSGEEMPHISPGEAPQPRKLRRMSVSSANGRVTFRRSIGAEYEDEPMWMDPEDRGLDMGMNMNMNMNMNMGPAGMPMTLPLSMGRNLNVNMGAGPRRMVGGEAMEHMNPTMRGYAGPGMPRYRGGVAGGSLAMPPNPYAARNFTLHHTQSYPDRPASAQSYHPMRSLPPYGRRYPIPPYHHMNPHAHGPSQQPELPIEESELRIAPKRNLDAEPKDSTMNGQLFNKRKRSAREPKRPQSAPPVQLKGFAAVHALDALADEALKRSPQKCTTSPADTDVPDEQEGAERQHSNEYRSSSGSYGGSLHLLAELALRFEADYVAAANAKATEDKAPANTPMETPIESQSQSQVHSPPVQKQQSDEVEHEGGLDGDSAVDRVFSSEPQQTQATAEHEQDREIARTLSSLNSAGSINSTTKNAPGRRGDEALRALTAALFMADDSTTLHASKQQHSGTKYAHTRDTQTPHTPWQHMQEAETNQHQTAKLELSPAAVHSLGQDQGSLARETSGVASKDVTTNVQDDESRSHHDESQAVAQAQIHEPSEHTDVSPHTNKTQRRPELETQDTQTALVSGASVETDTHPVNSVSVVSVMSTQSKCSGNVTADGSANAWVKHNPTTMGSAVFEVNGVAEKSERVMNAEISTAR